MNNSSEPLDRIISIVIVLFILSVITEKLTHLLRTYPKQFRALGILFCAFCYLTLASNLFHRGATIGNGSLLFLFLLNTLLLICILANMSFVRISSAPKAVKAFRILQNVGKGVVASDQTKEQEVTVLSFLVGFCVAFAFKVNLITIFNTNLVLGWTDTTFFKPNEFLIIDPKDFDFDPVLLLSFLLTAFFLAFGSKFFHDLLDNLLQVKNLKRKLLDKATYDATTIKEFDDQLAKTTYEKNAPAIAALPGVTGVSFGRLRAVDGSGRFGFKVYTSNPDIVLNSPLIRDLNGKPVPVQFEEGEQAESTSPSAAVVNASPGSEQGTICLWVKDAANPTKIFLLTCYHVVKGAGQSWDGFNATGESSDKVKISGTVSGTIARGIRTHEMDAALVELTPASPPQNIIPVFNKSITSSRPTSFFDDDATNVNVYGATTKQKRSGLITGLGARWKINFHDGIPGYEMVNLIEVQKDGQTIVRGGDSGALIFTESGEALGMVVATTKKRTLAIPIDTILATWNLEIL